MRLQSLLSIVEEFGWKQKTTGGRPGLVLVCDPPQPPPPPPRVLRDSGLGTWRQRRPPFFRLAPTAPPFLV